MPPEIDIVDATWLGSRPAALAVVLADDTNWRQWWPDLHLRVSERRGRKGVRWTVTEARVGRRTLSGSMEVYLEPVDGGVVAHYFLRLGDAATPQLSRRRRERAIHAFRARAKRVLWGVGDRLDPGRMARVDSPDRR